MPHPQRSFGLLGALAAVVLALASTAPARADAPALLVAPSEPPGRALLLVLEASADGVAVLDARIADVSVKAARSAGLAAGTDELLLALLDEDGEPLVVGSIDVPWTLHGPYLADDGQVRCRGERQERVAFGAKLPLPPGVRTLVLAQRADGAPGDAAGLVRALRARPADAGLVVRGGGRLAELPGLAGATEGP